MAISEWDPPSPGMAVVPSSGGFEDTMKVDLFQRKYLISWYTEWHADD